MSEAIPSEYFIPAHLIPDGQPGCCQAVYPHADYEVECTRAPGHPGSHIAASDETLAIWDEQMCWDKYFGWNYPDE